MPENLARRPLRVAVVGCGWFAMEAHLPALQRLEREGSVEIVALCSRSKSSLSRAAGLLAPKKPRQYTELAGVLGDADIDAVDLILPIPDMPAAIRESLSAGKHVISEKPCAPTVTQSSGLLAFHAALEVPRVWAVAENWRFKPMVLRIKEVVRSGEIGIVQFADFQHLVSASPAQSWRRFPAYPGGHLLDSGVHFVALLRQVVGEVDRVTASVRQLCDRLPPADSLTALLRFAQGAEGHFRLTFAAARTDEREPGLTLIGSKGALYADFRRNRVRILGAGRSRTERIRDDGWNAGGVYGAIADFVEAANNNERTLRATPSEALRDVAVVEAMLQSGASGLPVPVASLQPVLLRDRRIDFYASFKRVQPAIYVECLSTSDTSSAIVESAALNLRTRAIGARYSWSPYLADQDVCLDVGSLDKTLAVDRGRRTVRVGAGVRLGELTRVLGGQRLCLPSLPFVSEISVGGAVATASHGTSPRWGTVSDFVSAMTLALPSGELRRLDQDENPDELRAARVAVGMLGVIVEIELGVIDMPWVRYSTLPLRMNEFLASLPSLCALRNI